MELDNKLIYVLMTSWKKRIKYVKKAIDNLKNQTLLPQKVILWLSSDELSIEEVPTELFNDPFIEIRWVKENLYVWKRFLSIKENPNNFYVICDDDFYYDKDYIKDLYECAQKHNNNGIICYSCNNCNPKGEPWGDEPGNISTCKKWIAGGATMWCPNSFPMEAFDYYDSIMKGKTLQCDECFLMPFIYYHKTPIYLVDETWGNFYKKTKFIDDSQECALHDMFFERPGNLITNKKNQLLQEVVSSLPEKYIIEFENNFKDFKRLNKKEKIIITLTSWKKRINNIPKVLETILAQTRKPDKIILNLSSAEFSNKEQELPHEVNNFFTTNSNLCEIHWVDGPNYKNWKKTLPTLQRFPNDCIINIDDDFLYPNDMIECLWNAHLKYPNNPISGNSFKLYGIQCQCGCASLVKLEYLDNIFEYATDEVKNMNSDDVFFTYVATKCGHNFIYCGKDFFINMPSFSEISPLSVSDAWQNPIPTMWNYLIQHYGAIDKNKTQITHVKTTPLNFKKASNSDFEALKASLEQAQEKYVKRISSQEVRARARQVALARINKRHERKSYSM